MYNSTNITDKYDSLLQKINFNTTEDLNTDHWNVGNLKGYDIQKISLEPNDVLLCHISANMDVYECGQILEELKKAFPNNTVLLCNEHVLKGITVLKNTNKVSPIVDIAERINAEHLFDDILRGDPNDFLY